ncbi:rhomboid family intramembrane serine protease [Desulfoluna butyratoxydans]|uniref:Peptidase s54 rhomboid domain n=1 Tax=Desulfoluna butyratoxydans TaxID=231438 RepID=A0A4U8YIB6_9BACT|nr:rhomboid family intramembrane serine protease [Desulfoluna butyratoxydans]VFQ43331.1 peptidase s54 rhomboid domain [Desulfoluna butyratoxydans]
MEPLLTHLTRQRAREIELLLTTEGIAHRIDAEHGRLTLLVAPEDALRCEALIATYDAENRPRPERTWTLAPSWSGFFAAAVILAVFLKTGPLDGLQEPVKLYAAYSSRILAGEWYRTLTALFLHSGWPHLLGNMAGLIIFSTGVFQICGDGVGWFLLLAASALANAVNAFWFAGMGHISFGASTLVFASAGLLASGGTLKRLLSHATPWRALMPLGAGLAILAFTGVGPGSDVSGHLLGFGFGLGAGVLPGLIPEKQGPLLQAAGLAVSALACSLAFFSGQGGAL